MGTVLYEGRHPGAYIVSEAGGATGGMRSRDTVTLLTGAVYVPGMVLGKVTATGKRTPLDPAAATGAESADSVCFGNYDASTGDLRGVITSRESEVNDHELVWPAGISANNKAAAIAALAAKGIIVR